MPRERVLGALPCRQPTAGSVWANCGRMAVVGLGAAKGEDLSPASCAFCWRALPLVCKKRGIWETRKRGVPVLSPAHTHTRTRPSTKNHRPMVVSSDTAQRTPKPPICPEQGSLMRTITRAYPHNQRVAVSTDTTPLGRAPGCSLKPAHEGLASRKALS